jgi:alpha-mannosidase
VFAENLITKQGRLTSPAEIASNRIRNIAPIIRQSWRLLMENHPHDSICGCSIDQVHDEMKPRFDQADQIAEEITLQALQAISRAVDTRGDGVFSSIVLFNPHGNAHRDIIVVEINVPEGIPAFELIGVDKTVIPHEYVGSSNDELANLLLRKKELRDTIGAINEGWVAGAAIVSVKITRSDSIVSIDAVLDNQAQPNFSEWQQAEAEITRYEADPTVTHFHVLAHTPKASSIRFITPEIPAFGWRTLWVRALPAPASASGATVNRLLKPLLPLALRIAETEPGKKLHAALNASDKTKPPFLIENEYFRVEAASDGTLTVTDKGTKAIFTGLNRFVDGGESGDEYNYSPPAADTFSIPKTATVKVSRRRLIATLEIAYTLNIPAQLSPDRKSRSKKRVNIPITSRITLAPGIPRIEIHTEVENTAQDHRLRVHFPAPFAVDNAQHDGHFEVVSRPLGAPRAGEKWVESPRPETHQGAFTTVSNGKIGLTIANRGLPEVEVVPGAHTEIAITLLRCVGWLSRDDLPTRQGHAGPGFETPAAQLPGKWGFDYAIIPHACGWQESYQQAYLFQAESRAFETGIHPGELPAQGSFIATSPAEFVISAVKAAESGKGWLIRGYNITAEPIRVCLRPLRRFARAAQVNLAEEEIVPLKWDDSGSVIVPVNGHEVIGVMFVD